MAAAWISGLSDPALRAGMAAAASSGVVSEAGVAQAFLALATELAAAGTALSASQFNDLKTIAANLNVGETASAYLVYVVNALVKGNAANATWTGGSAAAVSLGNLAAGASAATLDELIGKWLLGTDLPASQVSMTGDAPFSIGYAAVSASLFGPGGPVMGDVDQGYLGDCYLESVLAEVACQNPGGITAMITGNANNTYGIRFFINGQPVYVTVNSQLADGGTIFNDAPDLWASLVEKAYAQLQTGGEVTGNPDYNDGNSYTSIGNGGVPLDALEEVTGAPSLAYFYARGSSWSLADFNAGLGETGASSGLSSATVASALAGDLAAGYDVILSSNTNATDASGLTTLVADHAMSIYGYDSATGNLDIRNPWGSAAGQTWDTTFEASLATLLADGDAISVAFAAVTQPLTIAGTAAGQTTTDAAPLAPFSHVAVSDPNGGTETLTVTLSAAANGTLSNLGAGSYNAATGVYTDTGTAAAVSAALDALVFSPTANQVAPGQAVATSFTIQDTDAAGVTAADSTTSVLATDIAVPPAITGAAAGQKLGDTSSVALFAKVAIGDPNIGQTETVTVTLSNAADGILTNPGGGSYDAASGVYTGTGTAAAVSALLAGLVFVPTVHQVAAGQTVSTGFTIRDTDSAGETAVNSTTTAIVTATGVIPPALTAGGTASYAAGSAALALDPGLDVTDPASATLTGASVAIATGFLAGDVLSLGTAQAGISASYNASTGVLTLSGTASLAAYQAALDTVSYASTAGDPTAGGTDESRSITWTVTGGGATDWATSSLAVSFASEPANDLLLQSATGATALWQVNGGALTAYAALGGNPGPAWYVMATGAFFAADSSDILWQNTDGQVAVWQVQGTGVLSAAALGANPGPSWHIEGTGNFYPADGDTDIVWQNDDGQVALWDVSASTVVQAGAVATNPGTTWHVAGTGNFYGSGDNTILWQNDDGAVAMWQMNGTTIAACGVVSDNPGSSWTIKGTGDFYGDGHAGILFQNADGAVAIWEMTSGTTIAQASLVGDPGPAWHVVGTGDFNDDGTTDIAFQNTAGQVAIWEMNDGAIETAAPVGSPGTGWSVIDNTMRFIFSQGANEVLAATPVAADEFVFNSFAAGAHTITGFDPMQDVIAFSSAEFASFAAVEAATSATAAGAIISLGAGCSLLLAGIAAQALNPSNFALT